MLLPPAVGADPGVLLGEQGAPLRNDVTVW